MEVQCIHTILVFLTISNGVHGLTTNDILGGDLKGIHGELSRRNQGYAYPEINYDNYERPWLAALRQGQTGTTGIGSTTPVSTTIENEYIPYWPEGEWALYRKPGYQTYCPEIVVRYGPVCGRKRHIRYDEPHEFKTFRNLCELEKENWRTYRWHRSTFLETVGKTSFIF